jgi:hypothetical protein
MDSSGSRSGPVSGSFVHGNEPSGSKKDGDCLVQLSGC